MDVKAVQARLAAFAAGRGWDELHNPRNLAIALAGEAGMLLDLFRWLTDAQSQRIESEYKREAAEEAIADLVLHTLRLADKLGVDVERAIAKKLAENDANYPLPVAEPPPPVAAPEPKPTQAKKEPQPAADAVPKAKAQADSKPQPEAKLQPEPRPQPQAKPQPEPKEAPAPSVQKKPAPPPAPAEPVPAQEAKAPLPAADAQRPSPDKALPSWLDGIMPARAGSARKKPAPAAARAPEPPKSPAPARAPELPPADEELEAAPPPVVAESEPLESPSREPERYAYLDTDAAKGFVKSLAKRVDSARSDDPLLRELHDEVETLRRTLYSPTPKYSWMGDSLKTIRAILEEAATHSVGDEIRARDYIAQIDRMLNP
jgi:NTP pyrophosphatase (non-canonical NTP hydrolase)